MRPLVTLLVLLLFPGLASAKKRPPKIIPALASAKTIGVHCNSGQAPVNTGACREFVDSLRASLGSVFKVSEDDLPVRLPDSAGNLPDIYIDLWANTSQSPDVGGSLVSTAMYQADVMDGKTGKRFNSTPIFNFNETLQGAIKGVYAFVLLHSGLAAEECKEPRSVLGAAARNDASWSRFEEFCKKHGLK